MSSNLVWEPVIHQQNDLPDELKFALRKGYGAQVDVLMGSRDIPYLKGLNDGGVKGAKELIEAIEKHGEILVKEVG